MRGVVILGNRFTRKHRARYQHRDEFEGSQLLDQFNLETDNRPPDAYSSQNEVRARFPRADILIHLDPDDVPNDEV